MASAVILPALAAIGGGSAATGAAVLGAAATVLSGISSLRQSQSQANIAEANAQQAQSDALLARQRAELAARETRRRGQTALSTQRAFFGASGVTMQGSPLLVFSETVEETEESALRALQTGRIEEGRLVTRANVLRRQASATRTAGMFSFGTSLLTAGTRIGQAVADR